MKKPDYLRNRMVKRKAGPSALRELFLPMAFFAVVVSRVSAVCSEPTSLVAWLDLCGTAGLEIHVVYRARRFLFRILVPSATIALALIVATYVLSAPREDVIVTWRTSESLSLKDRKRPEMDAFIVSSWPWHGPSLPDPEIHSVILPVFTAGDLRDFRNEFIGVAFCRCDPRYVLA